MIPPDAFESDGGGTYGAGRTGADAGSAADALIDDTNRFFLADANGLGRADPQAGGAAGATLFMEADVMGAVAHTGHGLYPAV
jgi:hypothetical protein